MKNILIVEDDKALAEGIVLVLRQDGFSFQCCHNVKDAKKVLEKTFLISFFWISIFPTEADWIYAGGSGRKRGWILLFS